MAERPVFLAKPKGPELVETRSIVFTWHGGFADSQKKKNVAALHAGAATYDLGPILEVSRRSQEPLGMALSAFSLRTIADGRACTVECAFQGSKVFARGGPYTDLYGEDSRAAKRDERLKASGPLTGFSFEDRAYPLTPRTAFYDWIYLSALVQQVSLLAGLRAYSGFTDIEFNPGTSLPSADLCAGGRARQAGHPRRRAGVVRTPRYNPFIAFAGFKA